jgi:hypothetical protein
MIVRLLRNDRSEITCSEAAVAYHRYCPHICLGGMENPIKPSVRNLVLWPRFNPDTSEYRFRVLLWHKTAQCWDAAASNEIE